MRVSWSGPALARGGYCRPVVYPPIGDCHSPEASATAPTRGHSMCPSTMPVRPLPPGDQWAAMRARAGAELVLPVEQDLAQGAHLEEDTPHRPHVAGGPAAGADWKVTWHRGEDSGGSDRRTLRDPREREAALFPLPGSLVGLTTKQSGGGSLRARAMAMP